MSDVTSILKAIEAGDPRASEKLLPLVYEELRKLAAAKLAKEKPGQTLQATELVHEAYLRLAAGDGHQHWNSRGHFFGAAAQAMRRILVERARSKQRQVHGGGRRRVDLDHNLIAEPQTDEFLLALDDALLRFAELEPLKARLVELRYFAGVTGNDAAQILGISPTTADRHWVYARAWLRRELDGANFKK